jgi:peptidoglycan/LPS O-acetylase OafA/YrhL
VGGYLVRRVARIVPGFWVALVLVALWQHTPNVLTMPDGLQYFFFGQNLTNATTLGGIGPAWTLAVEAQFYVLLALVAAARPWAGKSIRFDLGFAGGMFLLAAVWRVGVIGPTDHLNRENLQLVFSLPTHADSFGVGILLATLSARSALQPDARWAKLLRDNATWIFLGGIALFLIGIRVLHMDSPFALGREQWLGRAWLWVGVATLLIAPFAFAPDGKGIVHRLLARQTVVKMGRWSFGTYLWHMAIFGGLGAAGMRIATPSAFILFFSAGVVLSFCMGAISWVVIERPVVRWAARRTARQTAPAPKPVTAQARVALEAA